MMPEPLEFFDEPLSRYLVTSLRTTSDLYLISAGNEWHDAYWQLTSDFKTGYHLHVVLSGKGTLEFNGNTYHIGPGQMFVLPDQTYVTYYSDRKDPWHYVWFGFGGNRALEFLQNAGITPEKPVVECGIPTEEFAKVADSITALHELTLYNEMLRQSLLFKFLGLLIQSKNALSEKKVLRHDYSPSVYVENAKIYIHMNYSKAKVADIAKYLGISQSYLNHIFKERTGYSLQSYLMNHRLEQAAQLLKNSNYSIKQIAMQIGYEEQLSFSRMFRNAYGISPSQFRDNYQISQKNPEK